MTYEPTIPRNSTVLVTGGTGFIGMHCIDTLLHHGFKVKATVRSHKKGEILKRCFPRYSSKISIGLIKDIADTKSLIREIKGCSAVLHLASPYTYNVKDCFSELVEPALEGTKAILKAAEFEPKIRRVVITSSFAAVFDATKGLQPGVVLNEDNFSPLTYTDGCSTHDPAVAYRASKIVAERYAWDFIKQRRPHFDLSVVCPPMVYGPLVSTALLDNLDDLNFSNSCIWKMANLGSDSPVPPTKGPVYVDVRDLAEAEYRALILKQAGNERFMVSAGDFCNQEICDVLRQSLSHHRARNVPVGTPGERMSGSHFTTDSSKAIAMLGISFRGIEDSVVDLVNQLCEYQKSH
ncbi:unnamed protein product [Ambrosiozyma monospora]|uniref:Unnamed protein product n=1 Tax=Ambrosiozyma monospora TaxID=43982 RepID=A0ACB5TD34_AMBMO|nr:unnamed protein product [Ambrosiozyma monospora]